MRRVELEVEHRFKDKFMGRYWFKSQQGQAVLGAARDNDIRLLGDDVNGIHAIVEFYNNDWVISDLGSKTGTWIRKKPIVEQTLKHQTIVRIGQHILKLVPREIKNDLFVNRRSIVEKKNGSEIFHQIVLKKHNLVIKTMLLGPNQSFVYFYENEKITIKPPQGERFEEHNFGSVTVISRLTSSDRMVASQIDKMKYLVDPSLKKPMMMASTLMILMFAALFFSPTMPENDLKEVKSKKNVYTRIIYDSGSQKKQRAKANKMKKKIANSQVQSNKPQELKKTKATTKKRTKSQAIVKVSTNIKKSGLSKLISKISKRASSNAFLIKSKGRAPDKGPTNRALASIGSKLKGNPKSKLGKKYKVSGVATTGKGGGSKSYRGSASLSTGAVGASNVGILEEETEVSGGLDKSVIAKYIESNLGQVRYCYERQLAANPDIYGKVLIKFTIGATGKVVSQKVGTTTLKSAMVEGCILRRISKWKFPTPEGGTLVMVSYPFLFKSSN